MATNIATDQPDLSRRRFTFVAIASATGLFIGLPAAGNSDLPAGPNSLHPLIKIGRDNAVTIYVPNPEIGQGIKTALSMIVAEELGVSWESIRVEQADWSNQLERQFSGGSLSVRLNYEAMRVAGATARDKLLGAAAQRLGLSDSRSLHTQNGCVFDEHGNQKYPFGDLAVSALGVEVENPVLKSEDQFRVIGRSHPDVDLERIVAGKQTYSLDVSVPGMVFGSIVRCPNSDGQVKSFDATRARAVKGVIDVFSLENRHHGGRIILPNCPNFVSGIVVIATHTWSAMEGARRVDVTWELPKASDDSQALQSALEKSVSGPTVGFEVVREDGAVNDARMEAVTQVDSVYELPFLAHVPMEPMNSTASVKEDRVEIWAPTQNPNMAAEAVSKALGIDQSRLSIHVVRSGGAFGRRFYADFVVDAVLASAKVGRPVKIVWTREDDVQHDYYRPASAQRVRAGVDQHGKINFWHHSVVSHPREIYLERDGSPAEIANYEFPAGFVPALKYDYLARPSRIPVGQWRAVEHSSNVFVVSSVIDELAHAGKLDPVALWLDLVGTESHVQVRDDFNFDASRLRHVIEAVAKMADWSRPATKNRGRGIAASYNQGAWVAEVVEVRVENDELYVEHVFAAIDCGLVVNPSGAENQVQGGIVEGLSAALFGEIEVESGKVKQSNFHDYRICRMNHIPNISVEFVGPGGAPRGLGEPPLPPLAPALCNAVFAACGQRVRRLPLSRTFTIT